MEKENNAKILIRYEQDLVRPLKEGEEPSFHNIETKSFREIAEADLVIFYKKNGECHIVKNRNGHQGIVLNYSRYKELTDKEERLEAVSKLIDELANCKI